MSDITDVVYVSYLVPAASLEGYVPQGLELQRLGEGGRWALFTFLTYRHGHFGFEFLGPIRQLLFSPIQSNWRIHVKDPRTKHIKVLVLSAIEDQFTRHVCLELGADDYDVKPFDPCFMSKVARLAGIEN